MSISKPQPKLSAALLKKVGTWLAVIVVFYFIAELLVFSEARDLQTRRSELRGQVSELRKFNAKEKSANAKLKKYVAGTFGTSKNADQAANVLRDRVVSIIKKSGMVEEANSKSKSSRSKKTSAGYIEATLGYSLTGTLQQAVNLVYMIREDPYLLKLNKLTINLVPSGKKVKVGFSVSTLIMEKKRGEKITFVTADLKKLKPQADLSGPVYKMFGGIASRNLFRPFIQKPPPKPQPKPQPKPEPKTDPRPKPEPGIRLDRYVVVDLSQYGKSPEVAIKDVQSNKITRYNIGDKLYGATIVTVDYRALPHPSIPDEVSTSRVILRMAKNYYSVEKSSSLDQKRLMKPDALPESLRPSSSQK